MNDASLAPGTMLGRYRIDGELGRGGHGEVYRAFDAKLERAVAIKVLARRGTERVRLVAEARAVAALSHPNVVNVFEVEDTAESAFMVMELVEGQTLRTRMASAPMTKKVAWLEQIASALAAAHRAGFVHRDIKPDNLLVADASQAIKVLDFGIAKRLRPAPPIEADGGTRLEPPLTEAGYVVGTPHYLSPEQLLGRPFGPAVDQWAWGVVAYEVLAGEHPAEDHAGSVEDWVVAGIVPPLRVPDAPAHVVAAIMKVLSHEVDRRFSTMDELCTALAGVQPEAAPAPQRTTDDAAPTVTQERSSFEVAAPRRPNVPVPVPLTTPRAVAAQALVLPQRDRARSVALVVGLVGVALAGIALLGIVVMVVVIGGRSDAEKTRRIEAAERRIASSKAAASLDADTACALAEIHVLRGRWSRVTTPTASTTVNCSRVLRSTGRGESRLEGVVIRDGSRSPGDTVDVCFRRENHWLVSEIQRGCVGTSL